MNEDEAMTLDPPGKIAVVGAGPIGLETALYGRFLGYDVQLIESNQVAWSWLDSADEPLPMTPSDCLSNLAKDAVIAQRGLTEPLIMPLTVGAWITDFLIPLSKSDLLVDRIIPGLVTDVDEVAVESDPDAEDGNTEPDDVPPDFRLSIDCPEESELVVEALILTPADVTNIKMNVAIDADYLFRIVAGPNLSDARKKIVEIFAGLGGRADLDLYRPRRG